jgi:monoamine oxidase
MNAKLDYQAETEQPVSKIAESKDDKLMDVYVSGVKLEQQFSAVISTAPLSRLTTMDLSECSIHDNFVQWSAMRELQYGPSIKIGLRFARAWWQDGAANFAFAGGQRWVLSFTLNHMLSHPFPARLTCRFVLRESIRFDTLGRY